MPDRVPCRVMTKSVGNETHNYVPDTEHMPKFDGVTGCKITQKNKCMDDFKYIYPMLDPDGKTRLVTERDFHRRIMHKYRHFGGYDYIYPVLTMGVHEGKRSDLIPAPKVVTCFVPDEVDRMIPQGVEQILTHYDDRSLLYIASRRGDIFLAATRTIPLRDSCGDEISKPNIKSVSELNEEAEPKLTKKQMRDIDRWKKQMEELNRFGDSLSGTRIVYFGCELNRDEWQDDVDILDWFAENYPEDTDDVSDDQTCDCIMQGEDEHHNIEISVECSIHENASDFEDNWKRSTSPSHCNFDAPEDYNEKPISQTLQDISSSSRFSVEQFLDCSTDFNEGNEMLGRERSRSRQL